MTLCYSKKIICIIKRTNVKYVDIFNCMNFLHLLKTKNILESHKKVGQNKDFHVIVIPSKDN